MKQIFGPTPSAYIPLGTIAAGLIILWSLVWIIRGGQTNAYQPILITCTGYAAYCFAMHRCKLSISDAGIECRLFFRKTRRVQWHDVQAVSAETWWPFKNSPLMIHVFERNNPKPSISIPLSVFGKDAQIALESLPKFRVR